MIVSLLMIKMECVQKQQTIPELEIPCPPKKRIAGKPIEINVYDKEFAELRRHYASETAIRELERNRDYGLTAFERMFLMR